MVSESLVGEGEEIWIRTAALVVTLTMLKNILTNKWQVLFHYLQVSETLNPKKFSCLVFENLLYSVHLRMDLNSQSVRSGNSNLYQMLISLKGQPA